MLLFQRLTVRAAAPAESACSKADASETQQIALSWGNDQRGATARSSARRYEAKAWTLSGRQLRRNIGSTHGATVNRTLLHRGESAANQHKPIDRVRLNASHEVRHHGLSSTSFDVPPLFEVENRTRHIFGETEGKPYLKGRHVTLCRVKAEALQGTRVSFRNIAKENANVKRYFHAGITPKRLHWSVVLQGYFNRRAALLS